MQKRVVGYETNFIESLESTKPEQQFEITLYWKTLAPLSDEEPYIAFLHVLDQTGQMVTQSDVPPARGLYPTSAWQAGEVVRSWHTLQAGLYRPSDGTRLPVTTASGESLPDAAAPINELQIANDE